MEYVANEETKAYYRLNFGLSCQEINDNEFKVVYTVENTGKDDLYYAVGSHYTYKVPIIPTEEQEDYLYRFGTAQKGGKFILENGLVVGKTDDIFSGSDRLMIGGLFENGSTILDLSKSIHYIGSKHEGTAYQVAFDGFPTVYMGAEAPVRLPVLSRGPVFRT